MRRKEREEAADGEVAAAPPPKPRRGRFVTVVRVYALRLAPYRWPAVIAFFLFAIGAVLRIASLGYGWHFFVDLGGRTMYMMSADPADSLIAGHGLKQHYPSFPSELPVMMYPPGLALVIAFLKSVMPRLDYESGMIPALGASAFFLAIVCLWVVGARRAPATSVRAVWINGAAGGALPSMLPVAVALAAFPPLVFHDLTPLGGAFAGFLLLAGIFLLVDAQSTRSWRSAAAAGVALGASTWFRMETVPVVMLLVGLFLIINVWRQGFANVARGVVAGIAVPVLVLSLYNYTVYGRFTAYPNSAWGLWSVLESCQIDKVVADAHVAEMNWTGTFGGFYFPDLPSVAHNIMGRAFDRLFHEVGIWKYAECGCNRIPGWVEGVEEEMSDVMKATAGIGWQPLSAPFTIAAAAGLVLAFFRRRENGYLLAGVAFVFLVEAFLAPWFTLYHVQHVLPLMVVGLVCLVMGIVADVPRWVIGRGPSDRTAALITTGVFLPFVFISFMAGIGSPVNLSRTPRYELETKWSELPMATAAPAVQTKVGPTTIGAVNFGAASAGAPFKIDLDARNVPPVSWIELRYHTVLRDMPQYRFALRHVPRMPEQNHYLIHGEIPLPSWILGGTYEVFMNVGTAAVQIGQIEVAGKAPQPNLTDLQKSFFVPPPNWKDSTVSPATFLRVDTDKAKAFGYVLGCLGWLATPEILAYVDLGHEQEIGTIVTNGNYGGWSGHAPDSVSFAVSEDGLRWTSLPAPRLLAFGDQPPVNSAFHIGIDGLHARGRYVRVRFRTRASSAQGFTKWGLVQVQHGHLFLSGIDVFSR